MSREDVKQKIIITAIACIESEGFQNVTIRKIAAEAGVNVAAVNYHFGSKEQLLKIALRASLQESFVNNVNDYQELWKSNTREALKLFLTETLKGAVNFPNVTKAHFSEVFNHNNYDTDSLRALSYFMTDFHQLIKPVLKQQDDRSRFSAAQLFSTILIVGMMPDLFREFLGINLKENDNQEIYLQTLLENFSSDGSSS